MKSINIKYPFLSILLLFLFLNPAFSTDVKIKSESSNLSFNQDNSILIQKIKDRITALKEQKEKLKEIDKWTDAKEKAFLHQLKKLENGLKKLGFKEEKILTVDEKITLLQKELKYLNNNKTNQRNSNNWSIENENSYQQKATVLIDSIIKLRMKKA